MALLTAIKPHPPWRQLLFQRKWHTVNLLQIAVCWWPQGILGHIPGKGFDRGRAISYHSSRQARRLNARHRRRHTCPRQRPVWSPLAMAMETLRLETGSRCIKRKVWQFTVIKIYYLFDFTMLLLAPSNMDDRFDGAGKAAISKPLLAVWSAADHPD